MNIETILSLVFSCVGIVAYVIVAVLAIKRKKVNVTTVDTDAAFWEIAETALGLVGTAETAYASITKGGGLKLKDVLTDIKELCEQKGISYNKSVWVNFITQAVNLLNYNKDKDIETEAVIE